MDLIHRETFEALEAQPRPRYLAPRGAEVIEVRKLDPLEDIRLRLAELLDKEAAETSDPARLAEGLRVIPGDLLDDEAREDHVERSYGKRQFKD